jgi:hypothetical protein
MNTRRHMYMILNYDNDMLCYDDSKNGIYRSVVLTYPEPRVLSFAPPKTVPFIHFKRLYPTWTDDICTNEYIKGTMLQLFYDFRINEWEISTETAIGGYEFKFNNTMRALFTATLGGMPDESLSSLPFLDYLPKEMSYTFILQPSSDRLVDIYLVSVYKINTDGKNSISYVPNRIYENWPEFANIQGLFHFPKSILAHDYADLADIMCNNACRKVVITNTLTGVRSILTTREYIRIDTMKRLADLNVYQFLCLNRMNKLHGFLYHFPKQRKPLMLAKDAYNMFIDQLHELYVNYYIHKTIGSIIAPYSYIIHQLHRQLYLPSLKTRSKATVNKHAIQLFLNEQDPREVLHLMKIYTLGNLKRRFS